MKLHVYPIDDLKPHVLEGDYCWCQPVLEDDLIVHNSLDERESYEHGRLPQ